jgi:DNA mismatch repair protein MutS
MSKELTPLMKQYWEIKSLHKDKILLFRMGDFFEMFYDDATTAAPIIGITLTQRNKKSEDSTPMCGMPHHSVANPINKLLSAGYKVALCDQIEDPKLAKGLVKRAVTRVLTPGMVYDSDNLKATESHYICAFDADSISFIDTTTGESFYFTDITLSQRKQIFSILPIAEVVAANESDFNSFDSKEMTKTVFTQKEVVDSKIPDSANLIYAYVKSLTVNSVENKITNTLQPFEKRTLKGRMNLSFNTIKHLEVFTNYKGEEKGSLFYAINRTQTSSGARMLRDWLRFPLVSTEDILQRHFYINYFREHLFELKQTREIFPKMGDIERRLSKIALPQRHGRDLTSLATAIQAGIGAISISNSKIGFAKHVSLEKLNTLSRAIDNTIVEDAPLSNKQGHIIKKGVSSELDEIIHISTNAQSLISDLETKERELSGISCFWILY